MRRFVGVDIATRSISVAYRADDKWIIRNLDPRDPYEMDGIFELVRVELGDDILMAIEEPFLDERKKQVPDGKYRTKEVRVIRPDTYGKLCKVFGAVSHSARRRDMKVIGVWPKTWREVIRVNGVLPLDRDALKEQSVWVAQKEHGRDLKHDEADALHMAVWAERTHGRTER